MQQVSALERLRHSAFQGLAALLGSRHIDIACLGSCLFDAKLFCPLSFLFDMSAWRCLFLADISTYLCPSRSLALFLIFTCPSGTTCRSAYLLLVSVYTCLSGGCVSPRSLAVQMALLLGGSCQACCRYRFSVCRWTCCIRVTKALALNYTPYAHHTCNNLCTFAPFTTSATITTTIICYSTLPPLPEEATTPVVFLLGLYSPMLCVIILWVESR